MTDTGRVLLTAAVLSASAFGVLAWRVGRADPSLPDRRVGELRVAQWAAILLAATAGIPVGLAVALPTIPAGHLDAAIGVGFVLFAGFVQLRDPREGLALAAAGFVLHALVDLAHRPGWLSPDLVPRWYVVGCASYNVFIAALCYWARRR
ncbi:MAG TPA: hypothetical protein VLT86_07660 [Vicinamibacterales bacterium]|nr:hypothetical protein [Vicinamibacterales bacterium]